MHDTKVTCPSIVCNVQLSVTAPADKDDDAAENNIIGHVVLIVLKYIRGHWSRDRLRLHVTSYAITEGTFLLNLPSFVSFFTLQ